MAERRFPIGIQSFEKLRESNFLYVDKTDYIWDLANNSGIYFLSRPRRFGKSLFTTTLQSYFEGRKDLFEGLRIWEKENARKEPWVKYPVIPFYLSGGLFENADGLENILQSFLCNSAEKYGVELEGEDIAVRFRNLIEALYAKTGRRVVILVDAYDKPLLSTMLTDPGQEEKNRQLYKGFFGVLKDEDAYIQFVFFTGVTKFTKVSIFSDLNQLVDISMSDRYSAICGISEEELMRSFSPEIEAMAGEQEFTVKECLAELKRMYDGYHFSKNGTGVYNPYSLLSALPERDFKQYWYETGTPEFLLKSFRNSTLSLADIIDGVEAAEGSIRNYRAENPDPIPLFYQTGYLTICGYNKRFRLYTLKFPNEEVKYGFMESLTPEVLGYRNEKHPLALQNMVQDLESGALGSFMTRLIALPGTIPYAEGQVPRYEHEWSAQITLILELIGVYVEKEVHTFGGRIDCVVKTSDYIYVFEYKMNGTIAEAFDQIERNGYIVSYAADKRTLYKVAVVFSEERRNITDWDVKDRAGNDCKKRMMDAISS